MVPARTEILKGTSPKSRQVALVSTMRVSFQISKCSKRFQTEFALNLAITAENLTCTGMIWCQSLFNISTASIIREKLIQTLFVVLPIHLKLSTRLHQCRSCSTPNFFIIIESRSSRQKPISLPAPTSPKPASQGSSAETTPKRQNLNDYILSTIHAEVAVLTNLA